MTFTLLRAGLPNMVVAAALAALPIVAIALPMSGRTPHASVPASVAVANHPGGDRVIAD
jgi:hypothetical protein